MDGLELLRSRNRFEEVLPSGLKVTLRLPRLRDCIIAGNVPLPVLQQLSELAGSNGDAPPISMENAAAMGRFQDEIVRRSIVAIAGADVEMTDEALRDLTQEDYDFVVAFGTRQSPKVATP